MRPDPCAFFAGALADGAEEAVEVDRLLEIQVGVHAFAALAAVVRGAHADHGHIAVARVGELALPELVAAHHRHHQVEQDDGRTLLRQGTKRLGAIARSLHGIALGFEEDSEHFAQVRVVFDD